MSIVELSIFIIFSLWDKLAEYYVDYSGTMTKEEIIEMLKTRAKRIEISNTKYENFLQEPTNAFKQALESEVVASNGNDKFLKNKN